MGGWMKYLCNRNFLWQLPRQYNPYNPRHSFRKSWARVSPPVTWRPRPPLGAAPLGALLRLGSVSLGDARSSGHVPGYSALAQKVQRSGEGRSLRSLDWGDKENTERSRMAVRSGSAGREETGQISGYLQGTQRHLLVSLHFYWFCLFFQLSSVFKSWCFEGPSVLTPRAYVALGKLPARASVSASVCKVDLVVVGFTRLLWRRHQTVRVKYLAQCLSETPSK